jgi:hypothetical protein
MELISGDVLLWEGITAVYIILVVLALIDLLRREGKTSSKAIWLFVIFVIPIIGCVFYYFQVVRKDDTTPP